MKSLLLILNLAGLLILVYAVFRFTENRDAGILFLFCGISLFAAAEVARRIWRRK